MAFPEFAVPDSAATALRHRVSPAASASPASFVFGNLPIFTGEAMPGVLGARLHELLQGRARGDPDSSVAIEMLWGTRKPHLGPVPEHET